MELWDSLISCHIEGKKDNGETELIMFNSGVTGILLK